MLLVVDANVVFSALIGGQTYNVFYVNSIVRVFQFKAPNYLFIEIYEHFDEILEKTKFSKEELEIVLNFLKEQIDIVPFKEYMDKYEEAKEISPDPDDVPYLALALKLGCAIWSNDKELKKQSAVKVYNTQEIVQLLKTKGLFKF